MQAKLDAISNGDFSDRLQETVLDNASIVVVSFGESPCECCKHRYVAIFKKEEIYEIPPYTPNRWNPYPEVTPPQGAMMRIKYHDTTSEDRKVERGFAIFDCGQWVNDSGYPKFPNNPQNYVIWFRPWIGPDEEGEE